VTVEPRDRELAGVEAGLRASLRTLDDVPVPPLGPIRVRERARLPGRIAGAIAAVAVLVIALALGERLNAWRLDRAAATPATASLGVSGSIAPDARYGWLVRTDGSASLALVNELGAQLLGSIGDVTEAVTSPSGRYVALWTAGAKNELRILDGPSKTVGAPLFSTGEVYARTNNSLIWASDSSAVVVATTADPVGSSSGPITIRLRSVSLTGEVRDVATYVGFSLAPLGWDRAGGAITAKARPTSTGRAHVMRFGESGALLSDREVADEPLVADHSGKFIASANCQSQSPCSDFVIHDAASYAAVSFMKLTQSVAYVPAGSPPPGVGGSVVSILFRPRSNDVLLASSHTFAPTGGTSALRLFPDAGRGGSRDLGVASVTPIAREVFLAQAYARADGSAVLFVHPTSTQAGRDWTGDLVGMGGARAPITIGQPVASVVLDSALVLSSSAANTSRSPAPSPSSGAVVLQANMPICPLGQGPHLDVELPPPPGDIPGTGSSDAESAFRKAFPNVTSYVAFQFGSDRPLASLREAKTLAWIVAGPETFLSQVIGDSKAPNNWFAYRATFLECRAPANIVNRPLYPTRTAAEVLLGLASDAAWVRMREQAARPGGPLSDPRVAAGTLGEPLLVRALDPSQSDSWAVPVMYRGEPAEILVVGRDSSGMGNMGGSRGYSMPSWPLVDEDEAKARVRAVAGSAVEATLVWCNCGRMASDITSPVWRVTTAAGDVYLVFTEGPGSGVGRAADFGY
jgi:hypothetical protein